MLVAYATTVISGLFAWSLNPIDRAAYIAAFTLLTVSWIAMSRRGGPDSACDYLSYTWLCLTIAVIAAAVTVVHLIEGNGRAALAAGVAMVLFAGLSVPVGRFAQLIKRLPELCEGPEEQRAFGLGVSRLRTGRGPVAVIVTDRRVVMAVFRSGRPRLIAQRQLSEPGAVEVVVTGANAHVTFEDDDGAAISVLGIPRGQGLRLAAATEARGS